MPVLFQSHITRADLRANPKAYYIFGDNLQRVGLGGQAREMRGEPNAIGIPTKRAPNNSSTSFFTDADYPYLELLWTQSFLPISSHLKAKRTIIFPLSPLGSGRAALPTLAPKCYKFLSDLVALLAGEYPP